jgi:hypothetical protein
MAKYSNVEYWDSRYQLDPEPFEWYQNFEGVKSILKPLLHSDLNAKILQIGCGNSRTLHYHSLLFLNKIGS